MYDIDWCCVTLPEVSCPVGPVVEGAVGGEVLTLLGEVQSRAAVVVPVLHLCSSTQKLQHHLPRTVGCGEVQGRDSVSVSGRVSGLIYTSCRGGGSSPANRRLRRSAGER